MFINMCLWQQKYQRKIWNMHLNYEEQFNGSEIILFMQQYEWKKVRGNAMSFDYIAWFLREKKIKGKALS